MREDGSNSLLTFVNRFLKAIVFLGLGRCSRVGMHVLDEQSLELDPPKLHTQPRTARTLVAYHWFPNPRAWLYVDLVAFDLSTEDPQLH